jgi:hypothetical protein
LANLSSFCSSEPAHSLGLSVLIFARVRDSVDPTNKCWVVNPAATAAGGNNSGLRRFSREIACVS